MICENLKKSNDYLSKNMIDDKSLRHRIRDGFPILDADGPAFLERFYRSAMMGRLSVGRYICREGEECSSLGLLISGRVRVFKLAENGREITLYRIEAGDSCVLTAACIMSKTRFPALAIAETDVEVVLVPGKLVCRWMGSSEGWRQLIFGLISRRLADVISVLEEVAFHRMDERIAVYLLAQPRSGNAEIETTHQVIAAELGTSREVISRILKYFETEGWILGSRGRITVLDPRALQRMAYGR